MTTTGCNSAKAILALCLAVMPISAAAQTAPSADPVAALLRDRGESYRRAPDSSQDPDELRRTQALNAEIVAQNELAENQERADQAAFEEAQTQHRAEMETAEAERRIFEERLRSSEEAQARYEREMADWRATVAACERNDRARCLAGRQPALP